MRDDLRVVQEFVGGYWVSTVRLVTKHYGGMWFETYVFPAEDGKVTDWMEVFGVRYKTRGEAEAGHERVVDDVRAGRIPEGGSV